MQKINEAYSSGEVWTTHGTLIEWPKLQLGWSIPIPEEIVRNNDFRKYRCPSHVRTFYSWLFKKIKREDLFYKGSFCPVTGDMAQMFPIFEMAGERHKFIDEILYVYNTATPLSDNKINVQLQRDIDAYLRSRTPYKRLEKSPLD